MERQKVEERRRFSKSEKITFLNKSNFVCSHCGKKFGYLSLVKMLMQSK